MDYTIFLGIIDVLYKVSILFLGFILVLGYLFYLGFRENVGRYLENTRTLDLKLNNARNGYIVFNILVFGGVFILLTFDEFSQFRGSISSFLIQVFGIEILKAISYMLLFIVLSILVTIRINKIESPKDYFIRIFPKDVIIALVLTFLVVLLIDIFESYVWAIAIIGLYISIFVIIPSSIIKWGASQAESLEIKYKTEVNLKEGEPLKNLFLYQTTDTDYRFEDKEGNEYVIPVANVDKIIYEHEKEED
jgi:hypothetical protein